PWYVKDLSFSDRLGESCVPSAGVQVLITKGESDPSPESGSSRFRYELGSDMDSSPELMQPLLESKSESSVLGSGTTDRVTGSSFTTAQTAEEKEPEVVTVLHITLTEAVTSAER
ncbi:hypothetical protein INR49_000026, partial [Caranx melampygus]